MSHIAPADIERVMEVSARLFAECGYDGVGIRQISEESGVKTSSIFYHFGSKAKLYGEIVESKLGGVIEMVRQAIKSLHHPDQKMEQILGTLFDALLSDRITLLLLQRDIVSASSSRHPAAASDKRINFISLSEKLLEAAFERPEERRVAFSLGSLIVGFCGLTAAMKENYSGEEDGQWYAEQRDEIIAVMVAMGKQVRRI